MAAHILTVKDPCPPVKKLLADAGCPIIVIADNTAYHTSGTVQAFAEKSQGAVTLAMPRNSIQMNRSGIMLKGGWQSYSSTAKQL
jgi:hypothetical protein